MIYCSIYSPNEISNAQILAESIKNFNPEAQIKFLCLKTEGQNPEIKDTFYLTDLDIKKDLLYAILMSYDQKVVSQVLVSHAIKYLLTKYGGPIIYFDCHTKVFSRLYQLEELVKEKALVIAPNFVNADKMSRVTKNILQPAIDLNFIAVSDAASNALTKLAKLTTDFHFGEAMLRNPSKPQINFLLSQTDCYILRDPYYNVRAFNLFERPIFDKDPETAYQDLKYVNFREFFKNSNDNDIAEEVFTFKDAVKLGVSYRQELNEKGFSNTRQLPYEFDYSISNKRIDFALRRLFSEFARKDPSIIGSCNPLRSKEGERRFAEFIKHPVKGDLQSTSNEISRYLFEVWSMRPDLKSAFRDPLQKDRDKLIQWARTFGVKEGLILEYI
jgi:hypothetical protein